LSIFNSVQNNDPQASVNPDFEDDIESYESNAKELGIESNLLNKNSKVSNQNTSSTNPLALSATLVKAKNKFI
jgi:hypothetical protein